MAHLVVCVFSVCAFKFAGPVVVLNKWFYGNRSPPTHCRQADDGGLSVSVIVRSTSRFYELEEKKKLIF